MLLNIDTTRKRLWIACIGINLSLCCNCFLALLNLAVSGWSIYTKGDTETRVHAILSLVIGVTNVLELLCITVFKLVGIYTDIEASDPASRKKYCCNKDCGLFTVPNALKQLTLASGIFNLVTFFLLVGSGIYEMIKGDAACKNLVTFLEFTATFFSGMGTFFHTCCEGLGNLFDSYYPKIDDPIRGKIKPITNIMNNIVKIEKWRTKKAEKRGPVEELTKIGISK